MYNSSLYPVHWHRKGKDLEGKPMTGAVSSLRARDWSQVRKKNKQGEYSLGTAPESTTYPFQGRSEFPLRQCSRGFDETTVDFDMRMNKRRSTTAGISPEQLKMQEAGKSKERNEHSQSAE
jgi:hypothetical protein